MLLVVSSVMKDIIVTTPKSESENSAQEAHRCIKNGGGFYFRRFNHMPKNLSVGSKIFYVEDGYIRGYGVVSIISELNNFQCDVTGRKWKPGTYAVMPANSWKWIKPIPQKGFQGYRYFNGAEVEVVGGWLDKKPEIEDVG
jgi:hypothetical protein